MGYKWKKLIAGAAAAVVAVSGVGTYSHVQAASTPKPTSTIETGATAHLLNGICQEPNGTDWYMYIAGKVDTKCSTIAQNEHGWWKVENGKVNFDYTGIAQNEHGWWRVENGKVNFNYNNVANNEYGWWKVENGKVNFDYTGIAQNEHGWWRIEDGKVNFNYNGVTNNEYGWWKVENGKVNFNFIGIASNENGTWYLKNGKVDFGYNGQVSYNGKTYNVSGGRAQEATYIWPLPGYSIISSNYGYRTCPFHGKEFHGGIDIPAAYGTNILACASGTVKTAAYSSSMGNYVVISHANGVETTYMHCSSLKVKAGQKVTMGQAIACVGSTGSSTGNHLDLRFSVKGTSVNPLSMVQP